MDSHELWMRLVRIAVALLVGGIMFSVAFRPSPGEAVPLTGEQTTYLVLGVFCVAWALLEFMHGAVQFLRRPRSAFRRKAEEISRCAHAIAERLENHDGDKFAQDYGRRRAKELRAAVALYDRAVFETRSREAAAEAFLGVIRIVEEVGAASAKGEMNFDIDRYFRRVLDLETLFNDPLYREEIL